MLICHHETPRPPASADTFFSQIKIFALRAKIDFFAFQKNSATSKTQTWPFEKRKKLSQFWKESENSKREPENETFKHECTFWKREKRLERE